MSASVPSDTNIASEAARIAVGPKEGRPSRPLRLRVGAGILRRLMRRLTIGRLMIVTPEGERIEREAGPAGGTAAAIVVLYRWRALYRLLLDGDNGFAEAYIDGDWDCPDLAALIALGARNIDGLAASIDGSYGARLLGRVLHASRVNTRRGSRRNIQAHYDLGNAFYRLWLDPGMSYSSALYTHREQSLEDAQTAKQDRALALLDVRDGQTVLEIGCGWGGLAERIGAAAACRLHGVTLSVEQHAYAQARLDGLSAQVVLQDYRDIDGQYDRIVSIEMFEAVGERYWPIFFETLRQRLAPGGVIVLQVITIAADRFAAYRRNPDFIQRHIFPGGMLPTDALLEQHIAAAGLRLDHREHFGGSYARTLADWRQRFEASAAALADLGLDAAFRRKWRYYLAYCEAGFSTGMLDVGLYRIGPEGVA